MRSPSHIRFSREAVPARVLDFGEMGQATAWLDLATVPEGTEVTWGLLADIGLNPVGRYMGLMMDRWVGPDHQRGLGRLVEIVEA